MTRTLVHHRAESMVIFAHAPVGVSKPAPASPADIATPRSGMAAGGSDDDANQFFRLPEPSA